MVFPILIALPIILLICAAILRAAVTLSNRGQGLSPDNWDLPLDENDWADYPIPSAKRGSRSRVPMPSLARGMMMVLCLAIVNIAIAAVIQIVIEGESTRRRGDFRNLWDDPLLLARIITLPVGFLVTSGLVAAMLPTTFRRGCLVSAYSAGICLGIAAFLVVPVHLLGWQ